MKIHPLSAPAVLSILISLFVTSFSSSASAALLQIVRTGTGSGSIGGQPFSNADFTITETGDTTAHIEYDLGIYFIPDNTATITISGLGTFLFTSPTMAFVSQRMPLTLDSVVGFERYISSTVQGADLFDGPTSPAFDSWDMLSSIGPVSGFGQLFTWNYPPVNTSGGTLFFSDGDSPTTFTATILPEPATLILLAAPLLLLSPRRRFTHGREKRL